MVPTVRSRARSPPDRSPAWSPRQRRMLHQLQAVRGAAELIVVLVLAGTATPPLLCEAVPLGLLRAVISDG
jgi:hypothetical protein